MTDLPTTFRRNPTALQRSLDGETVLYLPATDAVVVLDIIGSEVWNLLDTQVSADEVNQVLAVRFDQPVERVSHDTAPLFTELWAGGWLVDG